MRTWIIIILALMYACTVRAADSVDESFARLAKVDTFAFGGTGYDGAISQGEKDYRVIFSGPSPADRFEKLYAIGNPQAKCYALVGIRILNPRRFEELFLPLRADKTEVITQEGCITYHETISVVARRIATGEYK